MYMIIRTAGIMDIDKILSLEDQVFELHARMHPDWIGKKPMNYDYLKSRIEDKRIIICIMIW